MKGEILHASENSRSRLMRKAAQKALVGAIAHRIARRKLGRTRRYEHTKLVSKAQTRGRDTYVRTGRAYSDAWV